jgi:hypothetical protein
MFRVRVVALFLSITLASYILRRVYLHLVQLFLNIF